MVVGTAICNTPVATDVSNPSTPPADGRFIAQLLQRTAKVSGPRYRTRCNHAISHRGRIPGYFFSAEQDRIVIIVCWRKIEGRPSRGGAILGSEPFPTFWGSEKTVLTVSDALGVTSPFQQNKATPNERQPAPPAALPPRMFSKQYDRTRSGVEAERFNSADRFA